MRIITVIIFMLCYTYAYSQTPSWHCEARTTTPTINTWNWTSSEIQVYMSANVSSTILSPFYQVGTTMQHNVDHFQTQTFMNKDFHPDDGWELIFRNFGTALFPVSHPAFALYNKYTANLRVFVYITQDVASFNGAEIRFHHTPGVSDQSAILSHTNPVIDGIYTFKKNITATFPNMYVVDPNGYWLFGDFPVAFDPCACKRFSQLELNAWLTENANIYLEGRGDINQVYHKSVVNNGDAEIGDVLDLFDKTKKMYQSGAKAYKTTSEFLVKMDTIIRKTESKLKVDMLNEVAFFSNPWIKAIPYVGTVIGIFDFFISGGKKTATAPTPMAFTTTLNLKGNIKKDDLHASNSFYTPGSDHLSRDPAKKPVYDNVLGIFNLIENPKVVYTEYDPVPGRLKYAIGTNLHAHHTLTLPKINQYKLAEDIQYSINPAAGVHLVSLEVALVYRIAPSNLSYKIPLKYGPGLLTVPHGNVELGKPTSEPSYLKRMDNIGIEVENWPITSEKYMNDITFRTRYIDVSCAMQQGFMVYNTTEPQIFCKVKAVLRRNDANATTQDILYIATYNTSVSKEILGEGIINTYKVKASPEYLDSIAPYTVFSGVPNDTLFRMELAPALFSDYYITSIQSTATGNLYWPMPFRSMKPELIFSNTTISTDQTAYYKLVIGDNVTILNGVTLMAGKEIEVQHVNQLNPEVTLKIGRLSDCDNNIVGESKPDCKNSYNTKAPASYQGLDDEFYFSDNRSANIDIYPNPVNDYCRMVFSVISGSAYSINLYDLNGKKMLEEKITTFFDSGTKSFTLEIPSIPSGVYIIAVTDDSGFTQTKKIIVMK